MGLFVMDESSGEGALSTSFRSETALGEFTSFPYHALNADGEITTVNEEWVDRLGYDAVEVRGTPFADFLIGSSSDRFATGFSASARHDSLPDGRFRVRTADGDSLVVSLSGHLETDDGGSFCRAHYQFTDVESPNAQQRELRSLREVIENAGHAIYWTDADGTIEDVNPAFEEKTGYTADEAIGETPAILSSGRHDEEFYADFWETITSGEVWEGEVVNEHKDGSQFVVEQTVAPITDETGEVERYVAINTDISERERHRRERRLFEYVVESASEWLVALDADHRLLFANEGFREFYGLDREKVRDTPIAEVLECSTDEEVTAWIDRALDGRTVRTECEIQGESDRRTVAVTVYPIENDAGVTVGVVVSVRDVSDLKEREQQLLVLDRVLRHNISNRMTVIQGQAEALAEISTDPTTGEAVRKIRAAGEKLVTIAEKEREITRTLSRDHQRRTVDLVSIVDAAVGAVEDDYPDADISTELPDSRTVTATPTIGKAVTELLTNAVVHSDRVRPSVSVAIRPDGAETRLVVADDGPQIPGPEREILHGRLHIDPLYHGSGLGLWLVHVLAEQSGVAISSEPNNPRGNVVTLTFRTD